MRKQTRFLGNIFNKKLKQQINLMVDVIEYLEDRVYYVYSPAFDLVGYGNTDVEARESWQVVLAEYLSYTINKNTLIKDLENRGWKVVENKRRFIPPSFTWMVEHNPDLTNVFNKYDFSKRSQPVSLPALA